MKKIFIINLIISGLLLFGCKQEPSTVSTVSQEFEVDALVEQQAAFGWHVNQIVQTGNEIEEVTRDSDFLEGDGIDTLGSVKALKRRAVGMIQQMQIELPKHQDLHKPLNDSLIFQITFPLRGVRTALFYNSDSGTARFYEVQYANFAPWQAKTYDSSEVVVDVNFTLWDPSDDVLKNLHHTQYFKETLLVHVQSIISNLSITDFSGSELTGVELSQDYYYYPSRALSHLRKLLDINPDQSGTLREDFDYKDGKTAYRSVTFYPDYTGSFEKKFRDDTMVSGTFNSIEDDNYGAWTELIDFPAGRYLDKIEKAASVEFTPADSIFAASYSEIIYFSSGDTVSSDIDITIQVINGYKTTVIDVTKRNDAHGTLTLVEKDDLVELTGNWTTWNKYYIEITDTQFNFDGSGHVHYEVWVSEESYNNHDDPIIIVDYYFSAGGEGDGTISHEGESYQFTTDEGGTGTLSKGNKSKDFNLIQ